ncbi:synaptotagmin-like protein 1 isoform X2 [Periophthalmus magnuspinnatus]|uniref:synaptotagmin-like protein 1 isoform X2 n=1 Tax=Periophthalmus magnuspinnatus TaxID=409849 RepID=UPI00145A43B0|nr:synaptotagmin-like protein 1 isoform X2 [Periophthalmus magnuspinnatus]
MERDSGGSLDLSHLTEDEHVSILKVLQRDLELRQLDEGRVRNLQAKETDPVRLRSLSGAWFNDECSKRHNSWTSGCDLVHASMRLRKPKNKVTDVPLIGLFNGEIEETMSSPQNNNSPPDKGLNKILEENTTGQQTMKPTPSPRIKSPQEKVVLESTDLSKEYERISNGSHAEEPEDGVNGHDEDSDSIGSSLNDMDPASLKTSSSAGSLHSSYTLSGSMMSLFSSGDFGVVEVRGRIQFSLVYDTRREELQIRIYRCEDVAAARKNRSDPYVKAYLLPDMSSQSKKKTSVKKKTQNPVYEQTLRYKLRVGELRSRTLNLSVWHAEPLGRNVFLGEVELALGGWDWTCTQPQWQELQPRVHLSPDALSSRGTIMLSAKFVPEGFEGGGLPLTGELHIWLREAQGLVSNKGGPLNSFVRCYILPDASRQSGQKTRIVKHTISPSFNHTMVYDGFHTSDLKEACAELTVWQREGLKTLILGGIRLSCGTGQSYGEPVSWMDSTEEEISLWNSIIDNPNHWIDATLPIRTDLQKRP